MIKTSACFNTYRLPLLAFLGILIGIPLQSLGQSGEADDMKLIEQIGLLQRQLADNEIPKRDEAEKKLIELGTTVLDHLDPVNDKMTTDTIERIGRVRVALETLAVKQVTEASRVTLSGSLPLDKILEQIKKQTENDVRLFEGAPETLSAKTVELDLKNATFWETIHEVTKQTGLTTSPFESDRGILRLVPQDSERVPDPKIAIPIDSSGIFEATVTQVSASKNLLQPNLDYCSIRLRLRWEPRIAPISVDIPAKSMKVIDEFGEAVKVSNLEAVYSGTINADVSELDFSIPVEAIDRQVESLKSFTAELRTVLPGRVETFNFKNIGRLESGVTQTKAGVTVGFQGVVKNEDLFGVLVSIAFDDPSRGLESHLSWVFENKIKLLGDEGKELSPLATETFGLSKEKITIQYFFAEDPSAYSLRYQTPAAIVSVPVKIELKGIPLP